MKTSFLTNPKPKIVVIGGGLAGLTAAYRLQQAGMDVELYEARKRIGGRVLSIDLAGHVAELGGQNITDGGAAANLGRLIAEFDLELDSREVSLDLPYMHGEDLISMRQLLNEKSWHLPNLRKQLDELMQSCANMKEVLDALLHEKDPLYKALSVKIAAYEGGPLKKLSPRYGETLFSMLQGGLCVVHQEPSLKLMSIKGGNSLLPQKMAEQLVPRLHLNRPLKQISKSLDGSYTLSFHQGDQVTADLVILAIPCSVFERIDFEDGVIDSNQLKAIKNVEYGANAKLLVPISGQRSKRRGLVDDYSVSFMSDQQILTLYYTGSASRFSRETVSTLYAHARPRLERSFGNVKLPTTVPVHAEDYPFATYDTPVGYSWPNDPYARGSYSYLAAGQETLFTALVEESSEQVKKLFAPIQHRLYFAGEHTSVLSDIAGTMEAACESGERVARMILKTHKSHI